MKNFNSKKSLLFLGLLIIMLSVGCKKSDSVDPSGGNGSFTVNGSTYSGQCASVTDVGKGGALGNIDVAIATTSGASFIVYNMPQASSGTSNFVDGYNYVGTSSLYALCTLTSATQLATKSGTITKTGSRSFSFTCTVYNIVTNQSYSASGSGSY